MGEKESQRVELYLDKRIGALRELEKQMQDRIEALKRMEKLIQDGIEQMKIICNIKP